MVTVYLDYSPSFPPLIPVKLLQDSMPTAPSINTQNQTQQQTSVFKALGSYASRIRENGQEITSPPSTSSPLHSTPPQSSTMTTSNTASSSVSPKVSTPTTPAEPSGVQVQIDDGPWETVHSTKTKSKHDRERENHVEKGSNSRNWRDRPQREKAGESSKDGQAGGDKKAVGASGTKGKKGSSSVAATAAASTSASAPVTRANSDTGKSNAPTSTASSSSRTKAAPSIAPPTKPAWGLPNAAKTSSKATTSTSDAAPVSTIKPSGKTNSQAKASTAPTSPQVNGDVATVSAPAEPSVQVPQADAGPSSAPATSKTNREEKPKEQSTTTKVAKHDKKEENKAESSTTTSAPAPTTKVAAPPPTNPWNTRKPALASPAVINAASTSSDAKPSNRLQFGQLSPTSEAANPLPNGHANGHAEEPVKIGGKKKKKDSPGAAVMMDANQWPDVATAQVVGQKHEPKKEVKSEDAVEEAQNTKKPKWKAIPAAELLAAADEAAAVAAAASEAKQRAERKRGKHGESSKSSPTDKTSPMTAGTKGRKSEGKRSEIRLPPNPNGQTPRTAYKPTFGSVEHGVEGGEGDFVNTNGHASVPLSRQTSRASKRGSSPSRTALPSSTSDSALPLEQTMRFGSGPLKGQSAQNATAPLPQQPFPASTNGGNLPRPPRGGRASFSGGRGRGGHRGRGGFESAVAAGQQQYAAAYYGQPGGYGQPMFDPIQAQWYNMQMYGRGPMPPPPTPQTVVPGLSMDAHRFYVLGQVEYYFSMQNLAMDFFLRQQMDKEGWISIAMIASFNRIKNITPEVSLVKEMMELSSLLEVQGDHVRIRGEDSKKWVLPDAKPSPFPPTVSVSVSNTPATASVSDTLDETMSLSLEESTAVSECLSVNPENAFDMKDMGFGTELKYQPDEVKAALMKSGSGMGAVPSKGEGLDALEVAAALARAGAQALEESVKKEEVVVNGNALHDEQAQQEETKTESA